MAKYTEAELKQLKQENPYKYWDIHDIGDWCVANGEVAWLQKIAKEKRDVKVYPKKLNSKGKSVNDTSQPYTIEKRTIGFLQIKEEFFTKFMPDKKPEKKAGSNVSMLDYIMSL